MFQLWRIFHKKSIFRYAVPAFKSLRKISALSILFFWHVWGIISFYLVEKQTEIIFDNSSDWGDTHIHVLSIFFSDLFGFLITLFVDSYNQLLWLSSAPLLGQHSDVPTCFFLFQNMVNCGFGHLQELNNLWVCPFRAIKLNYCLPLARF